MKFNKTIIPIISVLCVAILIFSFILWKAKLDNISKDAHTDKPSKVETNTETKSKEKTSNESGQESSKVVNKSSLSQKQLEKTTANMDPSIQKLFMDRFNKSENVQFLIIGSEAMNAGNPGYVDQLTEALSNTYGEFVEVSVVSSDGTSDNFVNEEMKKIDWTTGFDLVLLEPFTLNNNGKVTVEDEQKHIASITDKAKSEVEDAVIVLQPSFPFYNAKFYLTQIQALSTYAEKNDIPYINHWTAWPDTTDEELKTLLTEEKIPNSEGAKVWATALIEYFTGQ